MEGCDNNMGESFDFIVNTSSHVPDNENVRKAYISLTHEEINEFIEYIENLAEPCDNETKLFLSLDLAMYSYGCGKTLPDKFYYY